MTRAQARPQVTRPQSNLPQSAASEFSQLDASPTLFGVFAALNAAGFDADVASPTNHPLRRAVRENLAKRSIPSLDALKRFVRDHKVKDPGAEFSQYLSFALLVKAPDFALIHPDLPAPPDVSALEGLSPLIAAVYKEAELASLWRQAQPYYEQELAKYTEPVSRSVLEGNSYFRNPTSGYSDRRFQMFVELLGPPNQVQRRGYLDDDFVVVTPTVDLPIEDIRHAYLHYLAEPLVRKFSADVKKKGALTDYAQGSPILDEHYKIDFIDLTAECFIKAVESRIARKPAMVDQALREGFVITPALAELLPAYEKQERSMRLYFPDLIAGIDLRKEEKRLDHIDFASQRPVKTFRVVTEEKPPELAGADKTLDEAETLYTARNLAGAKETFLRVLRETQERPKHAKAYYGLARIAVLERDPETGDRLFRKVLELDPDPSTQAWSLLYIARLADSQGDREQAQENYKAALAVQGAPDSVRQAAEKGLKEAFTKQ